MSPAKARHTGIVVEDLEKSLSFYQEILGLKILSHETEKGPFIENLVGIEDVIIEWVKLTTEDGFIVELLKYHSHPQKSPIEPRPANQIGCSHMAFTVDDIESIYGELKDKKYSIIHPPQLSPNGKVKVMYCYDAENVIVELVEEIH